MLKFICLLAVLIMPFSLHAEDYNPTAPSAAGKAAADAAAKSILPAPVPTPSAPATTTPPPKDTPSDKDKFEFFDKDKSGKLSYPEFVRYSGHTKLKNVSLQKRFLRLDKSSDYALTLKEIKGFGK